MSSLAYRVIATLAYSAQFQDPLTMEEIELRLVGKKPADKFFKLLLKSADYGQDGHEKKQFSKRTVGDIRLKNPVFKKLSFKKIISKHTELEKLNNQKFDLANLCSRLEKMDLLTTRKDSWILTEVLDSVRFDELVSLRKKRRKNSLELKKSLKPLLKFARQCSWIKAVGITGSTAVKSADEKADIDLMVVVRADRLWLTRWILLIFSLLLGKKRLPWEKGQDDWCFNLFLDEKALALPWNKQSLYFAYEACQIDWVYDSANIKSRFYKTNPWISDFLPQWYSQLSAEVLDNQKKSSLEKEDLAADERRGEDLSAKKGENFLNNFAFNLQKKHLHQKNKIPYYNLKIGQAFLHGLGLAAGWE